MGHFRAVFQQKEIILVFNSVFNNGVHLKEHFKVLLKLNLVF